MLQLSIEQLTAETFMPFGTVIEQPAIEPTASGPGWQWWGETALLAADGRDVSFGYLDLQPTVLRFDWAERHMHSQEALVPLGGDCLVYVAGPEVTVTPAQALPPPGLRVFRVQQGQGVLLHPGVWHGAPLALDRPLNVVVLLLQHTGLHDTTVVRFPDQPIEIKDGNA